MSPIKKNSFKLYYSNKKKFKKNKSKVTIVTVVYYGEKTLEKTIKNVLRQTYDNFEYIIIYSPSKDKTLEIIKKYQKKINKIVINYDVGIYQSMNLGAYYASGDYINYMNSGDYFYDKDVIKHISSSKLKFDVLYGNCQVYYNDFKRNIYSKKIENLKNGMIFSHQSCFVKTKIQKKLFFKKKYYYAADYDFFARLYKKKYKFVYVNKFLSKCMSNGIVDRKKHITLYQKLLISLNHFKNSNSLDQILKKKMMIFFHYFNFLIKSIIPDFVLQYLLKFKYFINR